MRQATVKTYPKFLAFLWVLCVFGHPAFSQLTVDFSMNKTGGCSPLAVTFTDHTTGASANALYSWDFGNGNTSTEVSPGAIFTDQKTYTVTLTVKDGTIQASQTKQITVFSPPTVDFSPSTIKGCLPLTVTFTSNSIPGDGVISRYVWDFGDGVTQQGGSSVQAHTYVAVEQSPVSLTVVNTYGCHTTTTKPALVQVMPQLVADFHTDKQFVCLASDPVQFINSSRGPGTLDYLWDFGDGHASTLADPQYAFNAAGLYTVKLTVHSSEGCTEVTARTSLLNVADYHSDFDTPASICKGYNISFNSNSTPQPTYSEWLVDGNSYGAYNGNNRLNTVINVPGTHTITLHNTFGACQQSQSKQVTVKDVPNVGPFTIDVLGNCGAPVNVNFKDATPGAVSWYWDFTYFGSPSSNFSTVQAPSFSYPADGPYVVLLQVTNADGCTSGISRVVNIHSPVVNISTPDLTHACNAAITAHFVANTTETLTAWKWDFGDGYTSTDPSPAHTFIIQGTHNVSLSYTTQNGCKGTSNSISVIITPPINVDFSAQSTTICGSTPALFTAGPYDPNIVYWTWDFGDGNPTYPTTYYANHSYSASGTYTVKLALSNLGGCDTVIVKKELITVLPPFPRTSTYANTCDSTHGKVILTQSSTEVNTVTWDFGDGSNLTAPGNQASVSHVYSRTGYYKVRLNASEGQCSMSDSIMVPVMLKQHPLLYSADTSVCTNGAIGISISNLETNPSPYSGNYQYYLQKIEYKDGTTFQGSFANNDPRYYWVPPISAQMAGFTSGELGFRVILNEAGVGCADTTNFIPMAVKGGSAAFNVLTPPSCFQTQVVFSDNSHSTANDPIQSWSWDFGDGRSATYNTATNVSHTYDNPGSYLVKLTIQDAGGCLSQSPVNQYINVNGPKASFTASGTNVPLNTTVYFYNSTNSSGSYPTTWLWDFGDGATSTDYSPIHTYPVAGQYTVTLTATGPANACVTTAQLVIIVRNFNTAFGFSKSFVAGGCPPALVSFTNSSVNYSYVSWYFGDGDTCGNLNYPTHVYEKPGKYIVTLNVYAPNGLTGQYIDSVVIPIPGAALSAAPIPACINDTVTLSARATHTTNYLWDFGDGSLLSTSDTSGKHVYTASGQYQASLLMQDANGCSVDASLTDPVVVRPKPLISFAPAQPLVCLGSSVTLQSGNGGRIYRWSPASGLNNDAVASPVASPDVTTTYRLTITDDLGCRNSDTVTVTVIPPGLLKAGPADTAVCAGFPAPLHASGENIYQWIGTTDGLSDKGSADPVAKPSSTTMYTVIGSDAHSCFTDTVSLMVKILPLPVIDAGPDIVVQAGASADLVTSGSNDIIQYNWSPSQYLSCSDCASPNCTPLANSAYIVTVKGQDGCLAKDTITVKVDCEQSHVAIPNAFTPNGDGENDVFIVKGISIIKHIAVYSRWGERVYERDNIIAGDRSACWDGTFRGQKCPTGVYVYDIEMACPTGGEFKRNGTVILVR